MSIQPISRRHFLSQAAAGMGILSAGFTLGCGDQANVRKPPQTDRPAVEAGGESLNLPYKGPNVVLIRFGGGVRRLETILHPEKTFCPFVCHEMIRKHGILFKDVMIDSAPEIETSHGQGTLYILTGTYRHYEDISNEPFAERFEAAEPTIFEYFRKKYAIAEHQALIINGEDRIDEEFYTFSNHHLFGVRYRSTVLSLYRFKTYLVRKDLEALENDAGALVDRERQEKIDQLRQQLHEMESLDYRTDDRSQAVNPKLDKFWEQWRDYYGSSGLVNPRGDRLLTTLALRALKELRPRLMMINYQDPDYVHWGNRHFYTRAIAIIDDGIRQIYEATQADEEYRNNTVFLIIPDCGRDSNRCMSVPFQHHFNSKSAHEIFVVAAGPGIAHPRRFVVDRTCQQANLAAVVGQIMNFPTELATKAEHLGEMIA